MKNVTQSIEELVILRRAMMEEIELLRVRHGNAEDEHTDPFMKAAEARLQNSVSELFEAENTLRVGLQYSQKKGI